ncbi:hypothetical protein L0F63_002143 [Massospora cicadina]|nr:hypothetical protein L0F63_002143 [Massospora cicadina]
MSAEAAGRLDDRSCQLTYGAQVPSEVTLSCFQTAFDLGINYFDTSEVYANGQTEIEIGTVIRKLGWRRSEFTIGTKLFWGGKGPNERGLSRKHIIEGLQMSLERLRLDYVDLVFAHRPDPDTPLEETVRAFNHVIDHGKAMYWGTSEWSVAQITEAHHLAARLGMVGPILEQPQYNLFHRERVEREYVPLFNKLGLGAAVWSPLGSGILSGKYWGGVPIDSRLAIRGNQVIKRMRDWLHTDEGRFKLSKLALAWCLSNDDISTVITGASNPAQIEENVKALQVVPRLTPDLLHEIDLILNNKPTPELNFRET